MADARIILEFVTGSEVQLFGCEFFRHENDRGLRVVRGKTSGAYVNAGTFQWTSAVKGMCALLVRHTLNIQDPLVLPRIDGGKASMACSLDYALSKGPSWLVEMFGIDSSGESIAKRLFKRSNPNLKRAGPVVVAVNGNLLNGSDIQIRLDREVIISVNGLRMILQSLETVAKIGRENANAVEEDKLQAVS